jgi:hypothetical protein
MKPSRANVAVNSLSSSKIKDESMCSSSTSYPSSSSSTTSSMSSNTAPSSLLIKTNTNPIYGSVNKLSGIDENSQLLQKSVQVDGKESLATSGLGYSECCIPNCNCKFSVPAPASTSLNPYNTPMEHVHNYYYNYGDTNSVYFNAAMDAVPSNYYEAAMNRDAALKADYYNQQAGMNMSGDGGGVGLGSNNVSGGYAGEMGNEMGNVFQQSQQGLQNMDMCHQQQQQHNSTNGSSLHLGGEFYNNESYSMIDPSAVSSQVNTSELMQHHNQDSPPSAVTSEAYYTSLQHENSGANNYYYNNNNNVSSDSAVAATVSSSSVTPTYFCHQTTSNTNPYANLSQNEGTVDTTTVTSNNNINSSIYTSSSSEI